MALRLFERFGDDCRAALVEFFGTVLWLLLGLGGIQTVAFANKAALSTAIPSSGTDTASQAVAIDQLIYISASLGLSLIASAWLFYRATGGLFSPNISTALLLVGVITPVRFVLYCIAQMVGAIVASALLLALLPGPLLVSTTPAKGINDAQAVFIEMFMTAALCLSVLMLGAEKHASTPFAPIGVGLTLFATELWGLLFTGGSLNTARSFGPAVVSGFAKSHWIYWVGPFLGSLLAAGFYTLLKTFKYWTLTPGQDATDVRGSPPNPMKNISGAVGSHPSRNGDGPEHRDNDNAV